MPARAGASALLATETSFRRQRLVLLAALVALVVASWAYLASMSGSVSGAGLGASVEALVAPHHGSSHAEGTALPRLGWILLMWALMVVAMMLPTSVPMLLLFARYWRVKHRDRSVVLAGGAMSTGYVTVWLVFAALTSSGQWGLEAARWLAPATGALPGGLVAGLVLAIAGAYQLTPLKHACLNKCRSPMMFLNTRWREGRWGPYLMGLQDGLHCLGCCWALMLVMFVTGVMNLLWMAVLALVMGAEKIAPHGDWLARIVGWGLIAAGVTTALT